LLFPLVFSHISSDSENVRDLACSSIVTLSHTVSAPAREKILKAICSDLTSKVALQVHTRRAALKIVELLVLPQVKKTENKRREKVKVTEKEDKVDEKGKEEAKEEGGKHKCPVLSEATLVVGAIFQFIEKDPVVEEVKLYAFKVISLPELFSFGWLKRCIFKGIRGMGSQISERTWR
jgi:hypothetical protein